MTMTHKEYSKYLEIKNCEESKRNLAKLLARAVEIIDEVDDTFGKYDDECAKMLAACREALK